MNGAKKATNIFERLDGEEASYRRESDMTARFGDFIYGAIDGISLTTTSNAISLGDGRSKIVEGDGPVIPKDIAEKIENPASFYQNTFYTGSIHMSPDAHQPLLAAAAGGRPVATQNAWYNIRTREYFIISGGRRVRLSDKTPEDLLRD